MRSNNEGIRFTANSRRMETGIPGECVCRMWHLCRLPDFRYGWYPSVELSRPEISAICSGRFSAFERIARKERENCEISVRYLRGSVTQLTFNKERKKERKKAHELYLVFQSTILLPDSQNRGSLRLYIYIYIYIHICIHTRARNIYIFFVISLYLCK